MTRDDTRRFLIAYDIPDDGRRTQLAKSLGRHGDRVQYSIFVVDTSPARMVRLIEEVSAIIRTVEDSVLVCDLGRVREVSSERFAFLGKSRSITANRSTVI